jgi:hypothetical protein
MFLVVVKRLCYGRGCSSLDGGGIGIRWVDLTKGDEEKWCWGI